MALTKYLLSQGLNLARGFLLCNFKSLFCILLVSSIILQTDAHYSIQTSVDTLLVTVIVLFQSFHQASSTYIIHSSLTR